MDKEQEDLEELNREIWLNQRRQSFRRVIINLFGVLGSLIGYAVSIAVWLGLLAFLIWFIKIVWFAI